MKKKKKYKNTKKRKNMSKGIDVKIKAEIKQKLQ